MGYVSRRFEFSAALGASKNPRKRPGTPGPEVRSTTPTVSSIRPGRGRRTWTRDYGARWIVQMDFRGRQDGRARFVILGGKMEFLDDRRRRDGRGNSRAWRNSRANEVFHTSRLGQQNIGTSLSGKKTVGIIRHRARRSAGRYPKLAKVVRPSSTCSRAARAHAVPPVDPVRDPWGGRRDDRPNKKRDDEGKRRESGGQPGGDKGCFRVSRGLSGSPPTAYIPGQRRLPRRPGFRGDLKKAPKKLTTCSDPGRGEGLTQKQACMPTSAFMEQNFSGARGPRFVKDPRRRRAAAKP